jgi:adducin
MTASSLLKVDSQGNVIEKGSTKYGLLKSGFLLHSCIHEGRRDVNAIIHIHTGLAAGLSALKCGLLPISQNAMLCGEVGYHGFRGILMNEAMREHILRDQGDKHKILVLRNHGVAVCGEAIEENWFYLFQFMNAACIQFNALASSNGYENQVRPPQYAIEKVRQFVNMSTALILGVRKQKERKILVSKT